MPFGPNDGHPQPHLHPHTPAQLTNEQDAQAQWVVVPPATQAGARLQQLHAQAPIVQVPKIEPTDTPITFSESDFPPLGGDAHTGVVSGGSRGKGKRGAWLGKRSFIRAGAPSPPPISTTVGPTVDRLLTSTDSTRPGSPNSAAPRTPDLEAAIEPSPITPAFPSTPRTPSGGYGPPHPEEVRKNAMYASQITQGFNAPYGSGCTATSGYLPPSALRTGQGQMFTAPQTTVFTMSNPCSSLQPQLFPARRLEDMPERTCDGRELFIGGLDVETWDEARVKDVFSQYGAIEDVRFVKPGYHAPAHRRAFAFVKFTDRDAPLRAITEEHLRVYDDRKIKVQLREANPPRKWSCRGGRGRFYQGHGLLRTDRESLDYDHSSSTGEALAATEECEEEPVNDGGHVRFASAPEVGSSKADDLVDPDSENVREPSSALDSKPTVEPQTEETENTHEAGSVASSWSDPAPDVSMETQNNSASTTATLADVTISPPSPRVETTQQQQELQSDPDSQTVSSTPPPSILDASIYAPSSAGSAPVNGYYQTPSWIPPYAVPPAPYPYGYYPQQVAGQQAADGSNTYPWMAALYRNVVPLVPWFNPPPGVELAPAPVRPTGYIQRDPGGIFIPVYPPERLGQYMSTSGTAVDQSQTQSQPGAPPIGNWQNLPSHPQLYPVPFTMQQAMMVSQQASLTGHQAQQQQLPMTGNGWITGPPPGTAYPTQHAPSSAPPPYPTPNSYYPSQASVVPANSRPGAYGQYDTNMHHTPLKNSTRRGNDYGNRLGSGPREGRIPHQRRGPVGVPGMNGSDQSFPGVADPHWQTMKNNGIPTQLAMSTSGNASQWN
ncbi:hypothetical protein K439DRAFT_1019181 [Ramaria rubella]|nr:hypothetical protein K439DRAFT_1019181 [Ramaria rubella]